MAKTHFSGPVDSKNGFLMGSYPVQITLTKNTNGTTPVTVIIAPTKLTINSVSVMALDTTASDIVVKNGSNTVATVAKGTTAGVVTGASTLANTTVDKGSTITVESSSTGNSTVTIILTPTA